MIILRVLSLATMISVIAATTNTEKANLFVDQLVDAIKNDPEMQLDPYPLEDRVLGFERKMIITVKGEAKLYDGLISGLTSVHRTDDSIVTYNKNSGQLQIRSKIGMGVLNAKTTGKIHFMNFGPSVTFKARIGFAEIDLGLSANLKTDKYAKLTNYKLVDLKGLDVKVEGLGPLNFIFNIISGIGVNFFNFAVKWIAEKIMFKIAVKEVAKIPIPDLTIE